MRPSLIQIGSKTAEKNSAQTNRQTNRHYENNGHLAVNHLLCSMLYDSVISRQKLGSVLLIGHYGHSGSSAYKRIMFSLTISLPFFSEVLIGTFTICLLVHGQVTIIFVVPVC